MIVQSRNRRAGRINKPTIDFLDGPTDIRPWYVKVAMQGESHEQMDSAKLKRLFKRHIDNPVKLTEVAAEYLCGKNAIPRSDFNLIAPYIEGYKTVTFGEDEIQQKEKEIRDIENSIASLESMMCRSAASCAPASPTATAPPTMMTGSSTVTFSSGMKFWIGLWRSPLWVSAWMQRAWTVS